MSGQLINIIAGFTAPVEIGTSPLSTLWLLPLTAAVAVVYKATKLPKITALAFLKETSALFASIIVFVVATALVLCVVAWLITS